MNTYAVIETGGKQYKVEKGTSLLVDRLSAKEGDKVALRPVMFRDKEVVAGAKELEKVKVEATVTEHLRGEKIKVFKYKPKKGYRRRAGHRSELTKLEVTEVKLLTRKPAAAKDEKPAAAKAEKPAPEKKPAAAKPAEVKKPAAAKKPAAKKPAAKKEPAKASPAKPAAKAKKPAAKKPAAKPAAKKDPDDGS
jgi:large subunit ribosomal protein L21